MKEPHTMHGLLRKHPIYGIKMISFSARRLQTVVEQCDRASKSNDARDKLFLSYVQNADSQASKLLRKEMPMLDAAIAALSATASELSKMLPLLNTCTPATAFKSSRRLSARFMEDKSSMWSSAIQQKTFGRTMQHENVAVSQAVAKENGIEFESAAHVLEATRAAILQARAVLK